MNIKILLPALAAAFLLSACGSIVPKPQTDLFTIAKFESDNTIVGQIANPEKQIVAYYDAEHRENAKPAKGGYYRMLLGRTAEGHVARNHAALVCGQFNQQLAGGIPRTLSRSHA